MHEPIAPDVFEKQLEAHLQTWRDVTPPAHLKQRIAAAITPPPRIYWRPLLAAGFCASALGVFLAWPGSPVQPAPAFAEVERAMGAVNVIAFATATESKYRDGIVEKELAQSWIRREPLAYAWHSVSRVPGKELKQKILSDARRTVTVRQFSGQAEKWKVEPPTKNIARDVRRSLLLYVNAGKDDPAYTKEVNQSGIELPPWQTQKAALKGKPVWIFTRLLRFGPGRQGKATFQSTKPTTVTTVRYWADAQAHRVVRSEVIMETDGEYRRAVSTDFRYDESAPTGAFDLHPPKEKTR